MKELRNLVVALMLLLVPQIGSAQLLYKISGKDLNAPSYVFGTHHLFDISFGDSIKGFREALNATEAVYGEIDMDPQLMQKYTQVMQAQMMMPQDTSYRDLVSDDEYAFLDQQMKKYLGSAVSMDQLSVLKPMALSTQLIMALSQKYMKTPLGPGFVGIDASIQQIAREKGKKVGGLETIDSQIKLLYGQGLEEQVDDLLTSLKKSNPDEDAKAMLEIYGSQDSEAIQKFTEESMKKVAESEEDYRESIEKLMYARNRNWMTQLPEIFKTQPTFVAVGAGHLHGEDGLITLLKKAGYRVEAVK